MAVAAFALHRLDDDRRDLVGPLGERRARVGEDLGLEGVQPRVLGGVQGELDRRRVEARPVELREVHRLARIGVGQAHRVAGAAVEGAPEVHDLRALLFLEALAEVAPDLPVEGDLQRVFHGEAAAVHEEEVLHVVRAGDAVERVHELGVDVGVDVAVGDLVHRDPGQPLAPRLIHHRRVVHSQRARSEEREEVEIAAAVAGVHHAAAFRAVEVEHDVEAVDEHPAADGVEDLGGGDGAMCGHGFSLLWGVRLPRPGVPTAGPSRRPGGCAASPWLWTERRRSRSRARREWR